MANHPNRSKLGLSAVALIARVEELANQITKVTWHSENEHQTPAQHERARYQALATAREILAEIREFERR